MDQYHAITPFFSWDNDMNESNENGFFNFWEQILMNKKIINIDDIDHYKKLYNEELDILNEQPENWMRIRIYARNNGNISQIIFWQRF
ncbi:15303_t:CDS:2 [Racocetra persica]|uniref:15303_t:CDS:1 n=1 Tax=Racocetra persica TaxID=160502 RepID=A0ACA9L7P7_9GLOM|nr:15303_t:CDS:2 [Racocetra persica]